TLHVNTRFGGEHGGGTAPEQRTARGGAPRRRGAPCGGGPAPTRTQTRALAYSAEARSSASRHGASRAALAGALFVTSSTKAMKRALLSSPAMRAAAASARARWLP